MDTNADGGGGSGINISRVTCQDTIKYKELPKQPALGKREGTNETVGSAQETEVIRKKKERPEKGSEYI